MTDLKRMRLLCGLRQIDCWSATGIAIHRLSAAERGLLQLNYSEQSLLTNFLRERWKSIQEAEGSDSALRLCKLVSSVTTTAGQR